MAFNVGMIKYNNTITLYDNLTSFPTELNNTNEDLWIKLVLDCNDILKRCQSINCFITGDDDFKTQDELNLLQSAINKLQLIPDMIQNINVKITKYLLFNPNSKVIHITK